MANIFSYDIKVTCNEKDIEELARYFNSKLYCCDAFSYQKRDYGFVGHGTCRWSFIYTFDEEILDISKKYKAKIEMFGDDDCMGVYEYMMVDNGEIIIQHDGESYPIDIDEQCEYDDLDEYLQFLNEELFGDEEDKYMTYEELEESEFCNGVNVYQYYRDFWGEEDSSEPIMYLSYDDNEDDEDEDDEDEDDDEME